MRQFGLTKLSHSQGHGARELGKWLYHEIELPLHLTCERMKGVPRAV